MKNKEMIYDKAMNMYNRLNDPRFYKISPQERTKHVFDFIQYLEKYQEVIEEIDPTAYHEFYLAAHNGEYL